MRVTLRLPPDLLDKLQDIARAAHRPPKYHAELLLWTAIEQEWQARQALTKSEDVDG